jgi:formylglycine-generating enzyme required for sulfatase activity
LPAGLPECIGRFRIRAHVGDGAFGRVYLAYDPVLERHVALKVALHPEKSVELFRSDARMAANLQHPNIAVVFDSGHDGPYRYIARAFVCGTSLDKVLDEREAGGETFEMRRAVGLIWKLAEALAYAHQQGVIHQDVKPGNVIVRCDGEPMLIDFGLAARLDDTGEHPSEGEPRGTAAYMAPEAWGGAAEKASDQYSLGCLMFELLTGERPFGSGSVAIMRTRHENQPAPSPREFRPDLPRDLEAVCLKCLEKGPRLRYPDCQALADDLRRWEKGEAVAARPVGVIERSVKWVKRRPVVAGLLGLIVVMMVASGGLVTWQWRRAVDALGKEQAAREDRERADRRRALAQIDRLLDATPGAVPGILADLEASREDVLQRLRELWREGGEPRRRMRLALALLAVQPEAVRDLVGWMLKADDPAEVLLVRDALLPHAGELKEFLWRRAREGNASARFRALVALARFDPDSPRWEKSGAQALGEMLSANPLHLGQWVAALRPVRRHLLAPLGRVFRGEDKDLAGYRQAAANVLAEYAPDRPEVLAGLLLDADARQYARLFPLLRKHREKAETAMRRELSEPPDRARERQARRQATAAATLLRLGRAEEVWPLFQAKPDPTARSFLVRRAGPLGVDARLLVRRLEEEDASARAALIVALGEYTEKDLPAKERTPLVKRLLLWYRDDPNAGVHGAIDWLLRHGQEGPDKRPLDWGQAKALRLIDEELAAEARARPLVAAAGPVGAAGAGLLSLLTGLAGGTTRAEGTTWPTGWRVNGQGQTLSLIPGPVPFQMGSPPGEPDRDEGEKPHRRVIGRSFAIATKPVTVEQFGRFRKKRPKVRESDIKRYSPEPNGPIIFVRWYEAAAYCNWLSWKEGIPKEQWCYLPNDKGEYAEGMKVVPDYLRRSGYRLPTEAEWEYACRGGTTTSRHYGEGLELLPRYAWFLENSRGRAWPVGQKRPNDLGLFDMHGNVWAWCHDRRSAYPAGLAEDEEDSNDISDHLTRILRGGSFIFPPAFVRSAFRFSAMPGGRTRGIGFRVGRTLPSTTGPTGKAR